MNKKIINEVISLRKQRLGYKRIARTLNLTFGQVSDILIDNGLYSHVTMPNEETIKVLIDNYNNHSIKELSKMTGIGQERIMSILKIKKVKLRPFGSHKGYYEKINHDYFKIIDDEHKAYWLGFLYADGYNNEKLYQVEMTLKDEDKYILEELKKDCQSVYDIKYKEVSLNGKIFPCNRLTLYSKEISQDLKKLGCMQKKSLIIKFPTKKQVPDNLIHHFMRGYFDGNGSIFDNKFMLNSTKDFLDKYIEKLRNNTNISKAGYFSMDGQGHRWSHASKKDLNEIFNYLYKDATIYLHRKYNKFVNNKNSLNIQK